MPRYVCVVSQEHAYRYDDLVVALGRVRPGPDELSVVVDRRGARPLAGQPAPRHQERRRQPPASAVRARGYSIVAAPEPSGALSVPEELRLARETPPGASPPAGPRPGNAIRKALARAASLLALLAAAAALYAAAPEPVSQAVSIVRALGTDVPNTLPPSAPRGGPQP